LQHSITNQYSTMQTVSLSVAKGDFIKNLKTIATNSGALQTLTTIAVACNADAARAKIMAQTFYLHLTNPKNSALLNCDPNSLLGAFIQLCQWGFDFSPQSKNAYLIPRGGQAVLQLGQHGFLTFARRVLGENYTVVTQIVTHEELQDLKINAGLGEVSHSLNFGTAAHPRNSYDRNTIAGAWAKEFIGDKVLHATFMSVTEAENLRKRNQRGEPESAWKSDYAAMLQTKLMGKCARRHFSFDPEGVFTTTADDSPTAQYVGYPDDDADNDTMVEATPTDVINGFLSQIQTAQTADEVTRAAMAAVRHYGKGNLPDALIKAGNERRAFLNSQTTV